jgi:DNA polymerase I-like protein with 3'-5' exonuclease and polymerase domains
MEYYQQMEAPMDAPLLELSRRGLRADIEGRKTYFDQCRLQADEVAQQINEAAGMKLIAKTATSPAKLKEFLYEKLRLPIQYVKNAKKQKVVSTNVVTIKRLMEQFPGDNLLQKVGKLVLRHRRLGTEANYVKAERIDADGRQRAQFRQDTVLGRLSSSATPKGTGANLQNVDRKLRRFYLPDTGDEVE